MARSSARGKKKSTSTVPRDVPHQPEPTQTAPAWAWTTPRLVFAVVALLLVQASLAVLSLVRENPTIDEVVHLPAGVSYWQKGTFRLYPHNPPLVKMIAAAPVVLSKPVVEPIYAGPYWGETPNKMAFAHEFTRFNAERYFELCVQARLLMPLFCVLGGLVVFAWSKRLYGNNGGLLSLALWVFCPNILAHGRLVTTDVAATAIGCGATFLFWRYLHRPGWRSATFAGIALGIAQLAKYSMLLLFVIWPLMWLLREFLHGARQGRLKRWTAAIGHGIEVVVISMLVINLGYGFEGFGKPLGRFDFVSRTLTVDRATPVFATPPPTNVDLLMRIREYQVNRFRGTWLAGLPVPLPQYYVTGFDEQKQEAEGTQVRYLVAPEQVAAMGERGKEIVGYPVFLDGELRQKSWWYYFVFALAYKVPEGTWLLAGLAAVLLLAAPRARAPWADELAVIVPPLVVLAVMSFGTNINLGLRYVLPIFPYGFIFIGKVAPWVAGLSSRVRAWAAGAVVACLGLTVMATALVHPHYLAYFNWASGGAARGSEHLIDSNLDWGQDLIGLREWLRENAPNERVGLAYFGQIPPSVYAKRGDPFAWYLPPLKPRTSKPVLRYVMNGANIAPQAGLYAVSASLVRGLPWRVYDSFTLNPGNLDDTRLWAPYEAGEDAFAYFAELTPIATIGHSIFIYRVTPEDAALLARHWKPRAD